MLTWAVTYAVTYGNANDALFVLSIVGDAFIALLLVAILNTWIKLHYD